MILFEEAYDIVINSAYTLGKEQIDFKNSLNRVLAKDVVSDIEIPPFTKSAMDGYACRRKDIKKELEIIETIRAGKIPKKSISKNQCSKIMTGAMLPQGADCVLMVEHTKETEDNKICYTKSDTNDNIIYKNEDVKSGDIVLKKGTKIKPQHIAMLATVGCIRPFVIRQPKVGIISTGDELVEPNKKPKLSQIRNSNAYQLIAQIQQVGAIPNYFGITKDSKDIIYNTVLKALHSNDVLILTGGVSMGDFDFVLEIMEKANIKILFNKVAVKPGKPTSFGIAKNKTFFGLPGNPVSSFLQFELLVKPFLYKMMGFDYSPFYVKLPMAVEYKRKNAARKSFIPVTFTNEETIMPVEYHGSAHIHSLSYADGIIFIQINKNILKKGEIVNVRRI
jgi:molybdopterin molybdotransferase